MLIFIVICLFEALPGYNYSAVCFLVENRGMRTAWRPCARRMTHSKRWLLWNQT
jgi:hypothetical protein